MRDLIHIVRTHPELAVYSVGADANALIRLIESIVSVEIAEEDETSAILMGEWIGDPFPDIDAALPQRGMRRVEPVIAASADPLDHDGPDLGAETLLQPA
ncbi:MAG: hypothetical protein ABI411_12620 [Tahibacter sp.]